MPDSDDCNYTKGRILLVEDARSVRDAACSLLLNDGYRATAAPNGLKALTMFHRAPQPFDLLVTDCDMPGMSGAEVASACLSLNPEIGVLYTSGLRPDEELLAGLQTGRRAFLSKPFRSHDLLRKVGQLLAPRFERDIALVTPSASASIW